MGAGLGCENAWLNVYLNNRPPLESYETLRHLRAMERGEIALIAQETGNHWRKIFNVYAKLMFELSETGYDSWQAYRDGMLLQQNSGTALWFSSPCSSEVAKSFAGPQKRIQLISGRHYAQSLGLLAMETIDKDFSINRERALIVVPYFDYRQLSNQKLEILRALILEL